MIVDFDYQFQSSLTTVYFVVILHLHLLLLLISPSRERVPDSFFESIILQPIYWNGRQTPFLEDASNPDNRARPCLGFYGVYTDAERCL